MHLSHLNVWSSSAFLFLQSCNCCRKAYTQHKPDFTQESTTDPSVYHKHNIYPFWFQIQTLLLKMWHCLDCASDNSCVYYAACSSLIVQTRCDLKPFAHFERERESTRGDSHRLFMKLCLTESFKLLYKLCDEEIWIVHHLQHYNYFTCAGQRLRHMYVCMCVYIYPPETQLWSFCLCSGHFILVNFSETSHGGLRSLDVLYRAHSGLYRDTKCLEVSPLPHPRSLKMAKFNLVKNVTSLCKYDYIL